MNKNISVWRGSEPPPTKYHVWVKTDNSIYLHNGQDWEEISADSSRLSQLEDKVEKITTGNIIWTDVY